VKLRLVFAENLTYPPFPEIPSGRLGIRFPGYDDPYHGLCFRRLFSGCFALADPQIKKLSSGKPSFFDEMLEGCLPADTLLGAKPFPGLQR
jgi:hypothetical protein